MYNDLEKIFARPKLFEFYTAKELWTDEHISEQMLNYHLDDSVDLSSRNSKFIDESVKWIVEKFKLTSESKVIDFGCGPGHYTIRLAKYGTQVTGIDFSKRSLDYAKETAQNENLKIQYLNENYLEIELDEKFDLIIMIMCDFGALSPEQRSSLLKKFSMMLNKDGSVLLDVPTLNMFDKFEEKAICEPNLFNNFWSPNRYYGFQNSFKYTNEKVTLDKFTIIEDKRTFNIYNWLQYFDKETLEKEFAAYGFEIDSFYSNVAGLEYSLESDEIAVIARN